MTERIVMAHVRALTKCTRISKSTKKSKEESGRRREDGVEGAPHGGLRREEMRLDEERSLRVCRRWDGWTRRANCDCLSLSYNVQSRLPCTGAME